MMTANANSEYDLILVKHNDLVDKFLEIAERKVSVLDDYGDENWDCLPEEIDRCLAKIAKRREPYINLTKAVVRHFRSHKLARPITFYREDCARYLSQSLDAKFRTHHQSRKTLSGAAQDLSALTGVDFEIHVAKLLLEAGFESVVGTPATGDQGADLIAKRNGKTIAIQTKGYTGTVGNGAVQEIVGALRFYNADEGWVVTNSTFTASARSLAQANNIRLIDGHDLRDFASLRGKL
jgi:HJR/Mrr/RecB family endonuclease